MGAGRELHALEREAERLRNPTGQRGAAAEHGAAGRWTRPKLPEAAGIEALQWGNAGRLWGDWFSQQQEQFGDVLDRQAVVLEFGFGRGMQKRPPGECVNALLARATNSLLPRIFPTVSGRGGLTLPDALNLEPGWAPTSGKGRDLANKLRLVAETISFRGPSEFTSKGAWVLIGSGTASTAEGGEFTAALRDSLGKDTTLLEDESLGIHKVILARTELGLPACRFPCVAGRLKESYLKVQGDPRRTLTLHTSAEWETSLPNLGPDADKDASKA